MIVNKIATPNDIFVYLENLHLILEIPRKIGSIATATLRGADLEAQTPGDDSREDAAHHCDPHRSTGERSLQRGVASHRSNDSHVGDESR